MGEWLAGNWGSVVLVVMFGWLLWENRALRTRLDTLTDRITDIDKRLVHVEAVIEERIPRRPWASTNEEQGR